MLNYGMRHVNDATIMSLYYLMKIYVGVFISEYY